ncbi:MAG: DUF5753 domain-containing protein [Actinomycetota bacterium]|nr:DUF5753 domain-containing protein [Actinomycetota bacterium]
MLGLYHVPVKARQALMEMVRNGHDPNWWQLEGPDLPASWREVIEFESDSAAIINFESTLVPGLLQTSEYAAAILRGTDPSRTDERIAAMVDTRMSRRALLAKRDAPTLIAIIDESILLRPAGGPGVMSRQLRHLAASAKRSNVTVRIVPLAIGATPGLNGPTALYELRDGHSVVYLETRGSYGFLSEEPAVRRAKIDLHELCAVSLAPAESVQRLLAAAIEMESAPQEQST